MIVVSDTTPLISLMKISRLDLLPELFGEVMIPTAVFEELTSNLSYQAEAQQIRDAAFIRVISVDDPTMVDDFRQSTGLDLGESEAIIYANSAKADALLIDERRGRQVAKNMGLQLMGTVGIILVAHRKEILSQDEAEAALYGLRNANIRISEELLQNALAMIQQGFDAPSFGGMNLQ